MILKQKGEEEGGRGGRREREKGRKREGEEGRGRSGGRQREKWRKTERGEGSSLVLRPCKKRNSVSHVAFSGALRTGSRDSEAVLRQTLN